MEKGRETGVPTGTLPQRRRNRDGPKSEGLAPDLLVFALSVSSEGSSDVQPLKGNLGLDSRRGQDCSEPGKPFDCLTGSPSRLLLPRT